MSPEQRRKYNGRLQEQLQDVIDDYTGITSYSMIQIVQKLQGTLYYMLRCVPVPCCITLHTHNIPTPSLCPRLTADIYACYHSRGRSRPSLSHSMPWALCFICACMSALARLLSWLCREAAEQVAGQPQNGQERRCEREPSGLCGKSHTMRL